MGCVEESMEGIQNCQSTKRQDKDDRVRKKDQDTAGRTWRQAVLIPRSWRLTKLLVNGNYSASQLYKHGAYECRQSNGHPYYRKEHVANDSKILTGFQHNERKLAQLGHAQADSYCKLFFKAKKSDSGVYAADLSKDRYESNDCDRYPVG